MNIYMGWDAREAEAYRVAVKSCREHSKRVSIHKLDAQELYEKHLLWRPVERSEGKMVDHLSGAPQSTEFASSRFLVPLIHRTGWALFTDCDVLFRADVHEILQHADSRYAVQVVKHDYQPTEKTKMDGQPQTAYHRKNWSSVVLWNCDHPAHLRLTLGMVNWWPGALLHRFCWLRDEEIGALPPEWNVLVNVQPVPVAPKILHYTLGGPWLPGWTRKPFDELWTDARDN